MSGGGKHVEVGVIQCGSSPLTPSRRRDRIESPCQDQGRDVAVNWLIFDQVSVSSAPPLAHFKSDRDITKERRLEDCWYGQQGMFFRFGRIGESEFFMALHRVIHALAVRNVPILKTGVAESTVSNQPTVILIFPGGDLIDQARNRRDALCIVHQLDDAVQEIIADRKSTRLNSSHQLISYAVFCL